MKTKNKDKYIANRASELKEWITQIDLLAAKTEKSVGKIPTWTRWVTRQTARRIEKLNEQEYTSDAWGIKESANLLWDELRVNPAMPI